MEWAMNEHHQPFEEIRHMALKGKNFGQRENWHRYWIMGLAQFSKGTGPRDSSVRSQHQAASDHFVETTKMVVLGSGLNENLKMFISPAMPVTW